MNEQVILIEDPSNQTSMNTVEADQDQTSHKNDWLNYGFRVNDPSAGSPTETLLRLLLPLSDKVH